MFRKLFLWSFKSKSIEEDRAAAVQTRQTHQTRLMKFITKERKVSRNCMHVYLVGITYMLFTVVITDDFYFLISERTQKFYDRSK